MSIETMKLALEALEWCYDVTEWPANGESPQDKAIEALRAAIEQAEKREWQGLTKNEFNEAVEGLEDLEDCWLVIEAKLKEKNYDKS